MTELLDLPGSKEQTLLLPSDSHRRASVERNGQRESGEHLHKALETRRPDTSTQADYELKW